MVSLEVIALVLTGLSITASIIYYANVLGNANKTQQMQLETRQTQLFMNFYETYRSEEFRKQFGIIMRLEYSDYEDFMDKYVGCEVQWEGVVTSIAPVQKMGREVDELSVFFQSKKHAVDKNKFVLATFPISAKRDLLELSPGDLIKIEGEISFFGHDNTPSINDARLVGFKKKAQFTEEVIGEEALDLPPCRFPTIALWFDLPERAVARLEKAQLDFAGGLHATEHAAIAILPLFALCDRNDIGGVSTPFHPDTGKAQVFIYDAYPGGVGIAEKGFDLVGELWQATLKAITECPCQEGCPSCIQSPKCGNNNKPLDKKAAQMLLEGLLGEE